MELEPEANLFIAISPGSPLVGSVLPDSAALGFLGLEMLSSEGWISRVTIDLKPDHLTLIPKDSID